MDKIEEFGEVNGKRVGVIFIFDKYKKRHYEKDFEDFVKYQKKLWSEDEREELRSAEYRKKLFDFRFYRMVKEFKPIPFEDFRKYVPKLFSYVFFLLLKRNQHFIMSNEFYLQIKLIRVKNRSYYFEQQVKASTPEIASYKGAGIWFIEKILAPYIYIRKNNAPRYIDASIIQRFFVHELGHHIDFVNRYVLFEKEYEGKIKILSRRKSAYCLNYLYTSMFNLREEGLQEFRARVDSLQPRLEINMEGVRMYNSNLGKLTELRLKKDAEKFYEKEIGFENQTPSGEYVNGRVMCTIIALFIAKRRKSSYTLVAGHDKYYWYDFKNLDELLSKNKVIYILGLSKYVIEEAIVWIKPRPHYFFVQLYEYACDDLGISDENRVMTRRRFYHLTKKAVKNAREETRKRLKRNGFDSSVA